MSNKTPNFNSYFTMTIVGSGTARESQVNIGKAFTRCGISVSESIKAYINCKPTLNLICANSEDQLPSAVKSMIEREQRIYRYDKKEAFRTKALICLSGIEKIGSVVDELTEYYTDESGRMKIHLVSIHSKKTVVDTDGNAISYECEIDGKTIKKDDIFGKDDNEGVLSKIENNTYEPFNNDDYPIVVFQIDMLGEGMNINSFNSLLVTTYSGPKQIQQMGRILRNAKDKNGNDKKNPDYGHASVYCTYDNEASMARLFDNLSQCGMEDDSFCWGDKIDVRDSAAPSESDELAEAPTFKWEKISDKDIKEIHDFNISNTFNRHPSINGFELDDLYTLISSDKDVANRVAELLGKKPKSNKPRKPKKSPPPSSNGESSSPNGRGSKEGKEKIPSRDKQAEIAKRLLYKVFKRLDEKIGSGRDTNGTMHLRRLFDSEEKFRKHILMNITDNAKLTEFLDSYLLRRDMYKYVMK